MNETQEERKARERQEDLIRLRGLRPLDDDFMRCIFRDNIPLAQLVLRIITGKDDLRVTSLETQMDLKRLAGARSLCLDACADDAEGKKYDIEVQRSNHGAGKHRARYHSSCMDVENLDAGARFEDLPETYTIFITEHDIFKRGAAVYPIERVNMVSGELFGDGEHILYVNGAYRGDDDIGKLMHDFSCWDPDDMQIELLRNTARYYKENEKGVEIMCKAFEEVREEGREEGIVISIKNLMASLKLTAAQAMDTLRIPEADQPKYLARL